MGLKLKNLITALLVSIILAGGGLIPLLMPDTEFSDSERRQLTQKPVPTVKNIINGEYFNKIEGYVTDQFIPREPFRTIKAISALHLFQRLDFHGLYLADSSAVKMEYPLNEESVSGFIRKINSVRKNLLGPQQRTFYAVIPDKNYYFAETAGRLKLDYSKMLMMLDSGFDGMEYINLFNTLGREDYYKTDSHWRQERLGGVTSALAKGLGLLSGNPFPEKYVKKSFEPFYGVYSGQLALPLEQDVVVYLETNETKSALVEHIENGKASIVYDEALLFGKDPFDIYLSGATAVCIITNTLKPDGKELIIFRDSFASSLAPLLLPAYGKITLIDIRYISPAVLSQFVDFGNQDVLFLYSSGMINQSGALRGF